MDAGLKHILDEGVSIVLHDEDEGRRISVSRSLAVLYDEIELFNPAYGLVNAQGRELVVRHILDCLAPVCIIKQRTESLCRIAAADLGSGAGLPGLVLAAALPQWEFSLVERMGRRAGFLRNATAMMGLAQSVREGLRKTGMQVVQKDLSEVQDRYNVVTFRAFRHLEDIVCDLDRILEPNGFVFSYKSSDENVEEEISCLDKLVPGVFEYSTVPYEAPFCDAKRQILVLHKQGEVR